MACFSMTFSCERDVDLVYATLKDMQNKSGRAKGKCAGSDFEWSRAANGEMCPLSIPRKPWPVLQGPSGEAGRCTYCPR